MTIKKVGTRATIPAAVHGFDGSSVIRGACIWQGDLYLYLHDGAASSFKVVALNGQDMDYTAIAEDYSDWDIPWVMEQTEVAHVGNRRLYPGLHIHNNWITLITPDDSGYALCHIVPWEGGDQLTDFNMTLLEITALMKGSTTHVDVAYESLYGVRMDSYGKVFAVAGSVSEGGDVIDGPFDMCSAAFIREMTSHKYRMSVWNYMFDGEAEEGLPWGILKSYNDNIILRRGDIPIAKKVRPSEEERVFGETSWEEIGSINVSFDALSNYHMIVHEYIENADRIFYTIRFGGSNEIIVDMYTDNATRCSSANSIVSTSLDIMRFKDRRVNKIEVGCVDGFGEVLPSGIPVLFYISTSGQPLIGSLSIHQEGPFFDEEDVPLTDHVWLLTDENGRAWAYYSSPREVGDSSYTESVSIVAGFYEYDSYVYGE